MSGSISLLPCMPSQTQKFSFNLDHFQFTLQSHPSSSKRSLSLSFPKQTPVYTSLFPRHATFHVHGLFLDSHNNILWGTNTKEIFSTQFSLASSYFLSMWCLRRSASGLLRCDIMQSVRYAPTFRRVPAAFIRMTTSLWWRQQTRLNFRYTNTRQHGVA